MSAQQPDSSSRGQRSTVIGTSGASGPWPGSWPPGKRSLRATIMSAGRRAPWAAHASRIAARTSSASSGAPSRRSSPPSAPRLAQQRGARGHARLGGDLRAADARELGGVLRPPPRLEDLVVGPELDAVGAQAVGDGRPGARAGRRRCAGRPAGTARAAISSSISWRGMPSATRSSSPSSSPSTSSTSGDGAGDPVALEAVREHDAPAVRPRRRGTGRRWRAGSRGAGWPSARCRRRSGRRRACRRRLLPSHGRARRPRVSRHPA